NERLRRLDLMPERLVLVVLPHRRLLRPVLREVFVRGRDFSLDALSLRFEFAKLVAPLVDCLLLRGDLCLNRGHIARNRLQLHLDLTPGLIAVLKDQKGGNRWMTHSKVPWFNRVMVRSSSVTRPS